MAVGRDFIDHSSTALGASTDDHDMGSLRSQLLGSQFADPIWLAPVTSTVLSWD
jgi:hypothetical protein